MANRGHSWDESYQVVRDATITLLVECGGEVESKAGRASMMVHENLTVPGWARYTPSYYNKFLLQMDREGLINRVVNGKRTSKVTLTLGGWEKAGELGLSRPDRPRVLPEPKHRFFAQRECEYCLRPVGVPNYPKHVEAHKKRGHRRGSGKTLRGSGPGRQTQKGDWPSRRKKKCEYCGNSMQQRTLDRHEARHRELGHAKGSGIQLPVGRQARRAVRRPQQQTGAVVELPEDPGNMEELAVRVFALLLEKLAEPAQVQAASAASVDAVKKAEAELERVIGELNAAEKNITTLMGRINGLTGDLDREQAANRELAQKLATRGVKLGDLISPEAREALTRAVRGT